MKKAKSKPSTAAKLYGDIAPKLVELTDNVLFGDVWERPQLSKRDRSLITVATLIALNRVEQLPYHLERALSERDHQGRTDRGHHSSRVLFRLADLHVRAGQGERAVQKEVTSGTVPVHCLDAPRQNACSCIHSSLFIATSRRKYLLFSR